MKLRFLLLLLSLCLITAVQADERILNFHSDITVITDGSMAVTETIKVRAEGLEIKRGIYRDFPTDYRDAAGNRYHVSFDVTDVINNGNKEDYRTENRSNGVRLYIGKSDVILSPGVYTYKISYTTSRQLGFFETHDELYWNVTGNGWSFPIEQASATVHLPAGIANTQISSEAYAGANGEKGQNYISDIRFDGTYFETTTSLGIKEGLTIVVSWPKGYVQEPTSAQRFNWMLQDNFDLVISLGGLCLLIGYYLVVWYRFGRDPQPGVIIPLYDGPQGFSPGALRYIRKMRHDNKTFTVALVSLAVKGYLKLEQKEDIYTARRTKKHIEKDLGPGEKVLLHTLFKGLKRKSVPFKQKYHQRIQAAISANKNALQNNYDKVYFLINRKWLTPGIVLSIITSIAAILARPGEDILIAIFICIWLSGWSVGVFILLRAAYNAWRSSSGILSYGSAIFSTLFALPFVGGEIAGISILVSTTSVSLMTIIVTLFATNAVFYQWLKAPTLAGRAVLDQVEGLKLYLEVAEKDELKFKNPPEKTPELFERLFPYAIALGIEERWAKRFTSTFEGLEKQQRAYAPDWYHGGRFSSSGISNFAGDMSSSLSSAISSSSTAPGSSSGGSSSSSSSSGGSSGGGGGGGGGGGW